MVRLLNQYVPTNTLFQILLDLLLLAAGCTAFIHFATGAGWGAALPVLSPVILFVFFSLFFNGALGLYHYDFPHSSGSAFVRIVVVFLLALAVLLALDFFFIDGELLHHPFMTPCASALALVLVGRATFLYRLTPKILSRRILVVGTGPEAALVEQALTSSGMRDIILLGFFPLDSSADIAVARDRVLPSTSTLTELVNQMGVDEIIVAVRERRGGVLPLDELLHCRLVGVNIVDISTFFEYLHGEVRIGSLGVSWLIYGGGFRQGFFRSVVKRIFDIGSAMVLLAATFPIMLLAALAIKIESDGPIIYQQERIGLAGRVFRVKKFRSMYTDAEADGKPRWASANDSRITRVGKFIRKTRIDELPQLLNVLVGDMSMVGPRPERPFFVAQLSQQIPFYAARHSVKPGITGWAQVRYKYGDTVDDAVHKLQFDLYYIKNQTLLLDFLILFRTMTVVLSGEGAY